MKNGQKNILNENKWKSTEINKWNLTNKKRKERETIRKGKRETIRKGKKEWKEEFHRMKFKKDKTWMKK